MAEQKELILSLRITGTKAQEAALTTLKRRMLETQTATRKLRQSTKNNISAQRAAAGTFKKLELQLKADRVAYNQLNKQIAINNGVMKKTSGLTKGIAAGFKTVALQFVGVMAAFALVKNVIGIFKDFQQANADLAAVLGKSRSEIVALTNDAKRLGASTAFTASEVSKLQKEFAKLGFSEKEILAATEATLDLAAATNTELAEAARVAGATVRGFGLAASETQRVTDVMAKAFSNSALDMEKFSVSMGKLAPIAKAVGLSIEETTGFMGVLADAGIEASTIGTSMRKVFIELSKQGLTLDEALDKINNSQDRLNTAQKIFGVRAATSALILADNADKATKLTIELNEAGGAAKRMAEEQLDTLSGSSIKLASAWEGFILGLEDGEGAIAGTIRGLFDFTRNLLNLITATDKVNKSTVDLFDENTKVIQQSKNLVNEFEELSSKTNQTAEDKNRLAIITKDLSDIFGDSVVEINKETGAIELNIAAVTKQITIKQALQSEEARELLADRLRLETKLKGIEIDKEFLDVLKKRTDSSAIINTLLADENLALSGNTAETIALISGTGKLTEADKKLAQQVIDATFAIKGEELQKIDLARVNRALLDSGIDLEDIAKQSISTSKERTGQSTEEAEAAEKAAKKKIKVAEKTARIEKETQIKLIAELDKLEIQAIEDSKERKERELIAESENRLNQIQGDGEIENQLRIALRKKLNTDLAALDEEFRLKEEERKAKEAELKFEENQLLAEFAIESAQTLANTLFAINNQNRQREFKEAIKTLQEKFDEESELLDDKFKEDKKALKDKLDAGLISETKHDVDLVTLEERFEESKKAIAKTAAEEREEIAKAAFKKGQDIAVSQAIISGALAVMRFAADVPKEDYGIATALLIAAQVIATAAEVAVIKNESFAKGGVLKGKSHARGGIPTADGQMEFEGGEAVINKRSTAMFGAQLSAINQAGGGVAFGRGGQTPIHKFQGGSITPVPSFTGQTISRQVEFDVDAMAERIGEEIAGQIGDLRVVNVVSDTTEGQLDIENTESEASFG